MRHSAARPRATCERRARRAHRAARGPDVLGAGRRARVSPAARPRVRRRRARRARRISSASTASRCPAGRIRDAARASCRSTPAARRRSRKASPIVREHAAGACARALARDAAAVSPAPRARTPIVPLVMGRQTAIPRGALGRRARGRASRPPRAARREHRPVALPRRRRRRAARRGGDRPRLAIRRRGPAGARSTRSPNTRAAADRRSRSCAPRGARRARRGGAATTRDSGDVSGDKSAGRRLPGGRARKLFMTTSEPERALLLRIARRGDWRSASRRQSQSTVGGGSRVQTSSGWRLGRPPRRRVRDDSSRTASLRGCIGHIDADRRSVRRRSLRVAACSADPRFPAVTRRRTDADRTSSSRCSGRSSRSAGPRTSKSAVTACWSNGTAAAACCCRRSRPSGTGTRRRSSSQTCRKAGLAADSVATRRGGVAVRGRGLRRRARSLTNCWSMICPSGPTRTVAPNRFRGPRADPSSCPWRIACRSNGQSPRRSAVDDPSGRREAREPEKHLRERRRGRGLDRRRPLVRVPDRHPPRRFAGLGGRRSAHRGRRCRAVRRRSTAARSAAT